MKFFEDYRNSLKLAVDSVDIDVVKKAVDWIKEARDNGSQIFVFGNGGSASTAAHLACDLVKGASYQCDKRFKVLALTDNIQTITAYSNDVDYKDVFIEQLKNFINKDDLVIALSGSGNSENVIRAIDYANEYGCRTIGLSGMDGGRLRQKSQLSIHVENNHMGIIEDAHMIISHMFCYYFIDNGV